MYKQDYERYSQSGKWVAESGMDFKGLIHDTNSIYLDNVQGEHSG